MDTVEKAVTILLRSGVVGVSDECVLKLRDLIASCRALADSMGDHPTAKALRNMAERLELNLVMAEDERGSTGNVVSVR